MTPIPCLGPKACSPRCRDYGQTAVSCEPYGTASTDERLWGQDHPLCPEQTNHIQKLVDTGHSSPGPRTARGSLWNCPPLSLTRHCALCPVLLKSVPRWWSHKNSGTTPRVLIPLSISRPERPMHDRQLLFSRKSTYRADKTHTQKMKFPPHFCSPGK